MCELEPCLACQSDGKIIRGVTVKSLIFLISCHTNNTNFYMCLYPAANHIFKTWNWLHGESKSLKYFVKFPAVICMSRWAPIWLFSLWCSTSRRLLCLGLHMDRMLNPCCSLTVKRCQLALHLLRMARNQSPVTSVSQLCLWRHACVREHACMSMHDRWR